MLKDIQFNKIQDNKYKILNNYVYFELDQEAVETVIFRCYFWWCSDIKRFKILEDVFLQNMFMACTLLNCRPVRIYNENLCTRLCLAEIERLSITDHVFIDVNCRMENSSL